MTQDADSPARMLRRRPALVAALSAIVLAVLVGVYVAQRAEKPRPAPGPHRVAVLRFANVDGGAEDEYLADGITDEVVTRLAAVEGVEVVARMSAPRHRRGGPDVAAVGRDLGVDAVVEGSVRRAGGTLFVSLQLVEVASGRARWSRDLERKVADLVELPREIVRGLTDALGVRLSDAARRRIEAGTRDVEAYTLYLKGRHYWNMRTRDGFRSAIEAFEQAVERDPNDPAPYVGLAATYGFLGLYGYLPAEDTFPKVEAAATKALALDPRRADARTALGVVRMRYQWDWGAADRELRNAIALDPGFAPAHEHLGQYLVAVGRFDDGIAQLQRALALEPLSLTTSAQLGWAYYYARQPQRAIEQFTRILETEPRLSLARWGLGVTYAVQGQYDRALGELQLVAASRPDVAGDIGYVHGRAGRRAEARRALADLTARARQGYVSPLAFAWVHLGLGETRRALQWIERALAERNSDLIYARVDPYFDPVRSERRFGAVLERMGLDQ